MAEPLLQVSGLRVAYGTREVLRGIDFELEEGEAVALLGPNGSGKSTCLNAISGFAPITGGSIRFAGSKVSGWPMHRIVRAGIVQISQSRDLFPDLTVEDNLVLGGHTRAGAELDDIYRLFPRLAERHAQMVRPLSGGEQQMVGIGPALASRPRLRLLDEPPGRPAPPLVPGAKPTL